MPFTFMLVTYLVFGRLLITHDTQLYDKVDLNVCNCIGVVQAGGIKVQTVQSNRIFTNHMSRTSGWNKKLGERQTVNIFLSLE